MKIKKSNYVRCQELTLKEFLKEVRGVLEDSFPLHYRVTAEIARLNLNPSSGHCYPTLVEKEGETVVARTDGVIWKSRFDEINTRFRDATGQELKEGLKVLLVVEVMYHEVYGFKLGIVDIDPSYTLGEFALHRKKILAQLEKEYLLDKNKQLPFPPVPQRIAVISSASAAGYEDFVNTLENNPYGYRMAVTLFPSYMQGEQAEKSILESMQRVLEKIQNYDVLVIIRGGGDQVDLHCFDNYRIGRAIALFPVPVLTGIGHRRDETVTEIVSHKGLISPTAVGEFVVNRMREFEERLNDYGNRFIYTAENVLSEQLNALNETGRRITLVTRFFLQQSRGHFNEIVADFRNNVLKNTAGKEFFLKQYPANITSAIQAYIKGRLNTLEREQDRVEMLNPLQVLRRGYSITFLNGHPVKNADDVHSGDRLKTRLYKGTIDSITEKTGRS
jgi:exodeoxyribonuclease VII large subunit